MFRAANPEATVEAWMAADLEKRGPVFQELLQQTAFSAEAQVAVNDVHVQIPLTFFEDFEHDILISSRIRIRDDFRGLRYNPNAVREYNTYTPIYSTGVWHFDDADVMPRGPTIRVSESHIIHTERMCSICLTAPPSMRTSCGHSFCDCIVKCLTGPTDTCPVCRTVVSYLEINKLN